MLARDEIKRLRAQVEDLLAKMRRALGAQLDSLTKTDLVARIDELTDHNARLLAEAHRLRADNNLLTTRVTKLEDDLAAAGTSLPGVIRTGNRAP